MASPIIKKGKGAMQGESFDDQVCGLFAKFSSCSNSIVGHVKALVNETLVSFVVKASLIFLGTLTILIAVLFFMFGASRGLAQVLGVEPWLGYLITGSFFILAILVFFTIISLIAKKRSFKKKAEQKKAIEILSRKISEITNVRLWIQEYPFYSTGAAAVVGFTLSEAMISSTSKKSETLGPPSELHQVNTQNSIVAMALALAEDILKEAVVPIVKEYLKPKDHANAQGLTQ